MKHLVCKISLALNALALLVALLMSSSASADTVFGDASAITYSDNGGQHIYTFVTGTSGALHAAIWNGQTWPWTYLGTPSVYTKGPRGVWRWVSEPMASSPQAITYTQSGVQRIYAFAVGANGNLYVDYTYGGQTWQWADLGNPGVAVDPAIKVITYQENGVQKIYIFATGNGHQYVKYWDGSYWYWADQGSPGQSWNYPAAAITYWLDGSQRIAVFGAGLFDHHLYINYSSDGSDFWRIDQGMPINAGISVQGTAIAAIAYQDGNQLHTDVFATGDDAHLYRNYWDGSAWHWADQGIQGMGVLPLAAVSYQTQGVTRTAVFCAGLDGSLYDNVQSADPNIWTWYPQGNPGTGVFPGAAISYWDGVVNHIDVFATGHDGRLYLNYQDPMGWHWASLGYPQ